MAKELLTPGGGSRIIVTDEVAETLVAEHGHILIGDTDLPLTHSAGSFGLSDPPRESADAKAREEAETEAELAGLEDALRAAGDAASPPPDDTVLLCPVADAAAACQDDTVADDAEGENKPQESDPSYEGGTDE